MPPGVLIVFEGIDGAGKSTHIQLVQEACLALGLPVHRGKEPTDGVHGSRLRASAKTGRLPPEQELALFIADRREHVRDVIAPALAEGVVVLLDRYYLSTAAYQGVRGLDPLAILRQNEAFAPAPDRVILIDVDPAVAVRRVRGRDTVENAFEREEDLRRTREVFLSLPVATMRVFRSDIPAEDLRNQILHDLACGVLAAHLAHRGHRVPCDLGPSKAFTAALLA